MPRNDAVPPVSCQALARRIEEISTLPQIALRVLEVANDPRSGAAELKAVMESDVALSARVLRCVNSAAYSLRTKVSNLQQAISFLGMKQVRNLAMTAGVTELFRNDETIGSYSRAGLWRHLVSVAIGARLIAMRLKFQNFEDAFLAGLLHDLGIILEDQSLHVPFTQIIHDLQEEKTLSDVERLHLGFDHTELGGEVAELWRFPEAVKAALRYHHCSQLYRGKDLPLVRCVEASNLLCTLKGIPSVGRKLVRFSSSAFTGLGLMKEDIAILAEDFDQEFASQASLFQI